MILALDMSLRSSGYVVLDYDNNIVDFGIIETTAKEFPDHEDLIIYLRNRISGIIFQYGIDQFVIEGLSFNSKSSTKDVISGAYWAIRTLVKEYHANVLIGSIPVMTWRSKTINKDEKEFAKKFCRDNLKNAVFKKLPDEIQKMFLLYVENKGLKITAVFDLADAYFLGVYRNSLNT